MGVHTRRTRRNGAFRLGLVGTLAAAVVAVGSPALADPGDLDTGFGPSGTGTVVTSINPGGSSFARATALQPDGKILVAGTADDQLGNPYAVVARYTATGELDQSFNTGGINGLLIPAPSTVQIHAVAVQPDGKVVVAGTTNVSGVPSILLLRFTQDGQFDPEFAGGQVQTPLTDLDAAANPDVRALVLEPDGNLVVAGGVSAPTTGTSALLARYTPTGGLDPTFNPSGAMPGVLTVAIGSPSDTTVMDLVREPSGTLAAAGYAVDGGVRKMLIARVTNVGALDTSFNTTGPLPGTNLVAMPGATGSYAFGLVRQPDGKLVVAGQADVPAPAVALARFVTDGSLDPAFNPSGTTPGTSVSALGTSDALALDLVLQPDGKPVVVGRTLAAGIFAMIVGRFTPAGLLDVTFNPTGPTPGAVSTSIGGVADVATAAVLQPDGKLVAVGYSESGSETQFALVRYDLGAGAAVRADMSLAASASPVSSEPNQTVTYTFTVTNNGPDDAPAAVTVPLPGSQTFAAAEGPPGSSCSAPPVGSSGTVICTLPTLPSGGTAVVTVQAVMAIPSSDTLTAEVSTGAVDPEPANNTASATVDVNAPVPTPAPTPPPAPVADLSVVATADRFRAVKGQSIGFTVKVLNHGPNGAPAVLSIELDPKFAFVSASGGLCSVPRGGTSGTIVCRISSIGSSSSASFRIVVQPRRIGPAVLSAHVSPVAPATDPNPAGNSAEANVITRKN